MVRFLKAIMSTRFCALTALSCIPSFFLIKFLRVAIFVEFGWVVVMYTLEKK